MFGWGRKKIVEERARRLVLALQQIAADVEHLSYDELIVKYPARDIDPIEAIENRQRGEHLITVYLSETCNYLISTGGINSEPHLTAVGGGDDYGLMISGRLGSFYADLEQPRDQRPGRDARKTCNALQRLPGFSSFRKIEQSLGL